MVCRAAWTLLAIATLCLTGCGSGGSTTDGDADGDARECAGPGGGALACADDSACPEGCLCGTDGCAPDTAGVRFDLAAAGSRLIYRNDRGTFDLFLADGTLVLRAGHAAAWLDDPDGPPDLATHRMAGRQVTETEEEDDDLGHAVRLSIAADSGPVGTPGLAWTISAYPLEGFYTFLLELNNGTGVPIMLAKTAGVRSERAEGGGLFLGGHPSTHRIVENGSYGYFDFHAAIVPGDVPRDGFFAAAVPGDFAGHSVSNLDHAVADLEGAAVWIAGALTFEHTWPVINLSYDPAAPIEAGDGRTGFTFFSAEGAHQPRPKPVPPGETFTSELYYAHPAEGSVHAGLERWAGLVKRQNRIVLWTEKAPGNRIPNGWNSWTTSGSTGGYGTGIDEGIILANLDVMAAEFRDFGIDWFQIDDGWQAGNGDWWWNEQRFPRGPRWLSDRIREKGFRPGLWISPFTLGADSATFAAHPAWIAGKSQVGGLFNGGYEFLDLTHPEVRTYLLELFTRFRHEWGFEWLKMDFAYYALLGDDFFDPSQTREEAYRQALRTVRQGIGDDAFFLAVSALGAHLGLVDADRLTLDTMPVWDREPSQSDEAPALQQGFKPTVRTAARRWYLHDRVWINHSDLIVFRSNQNDLSWPRVTHQETLAFCSYVGLSGGIVKMGDKLVDLTGPQINAVRKLLPVYPRGGRPLDLLTREFPEIWLLPVDGRTDGYDEKYTLAGLFHWGSNIDLATNPYTPIPDDGADRRFDLPLAGLGLDPDGRYLGYEFWTETFLGEIAGALAFDVPPHAARVIALRPLLDRPQFLGWNRQITMGGTDLHAVGWNDATATLTVDMRAAKPSGKAPFVYHLAFHAPDGYVFAAADWAGVPVTETEAVQTGRVVDVRFVPQATGTVTVGLLFDRR